MKYFLSVVVLAMAALVSQAHATSVVYQDRDRAVAVSDGYAPGYRPQHVHGRPYQPRGVYKPQPVRPPNVVKMGPPKCGDKGHFDQKLRICVANEVARIDMPEVHKAYLENCPGTIESQNIMRDGVLVEQQRCNYAKR